MPDRKGDDRIMPSEFPIDALAQLGKEQGLRMAVMVAWDGKRTHVVTWGDDAAQSVHAASGGNFVKEALGWPDDLCRERPAWFYRLDAALHLLEDRLRDLLDDYQGTPPRKPLPAEVIDKLLGPASVAAEVIHDVRATKFRDHSAGE